MSDALVLYLFWSSCTISGCLPWMYLPNKLTLTAALATIHRRLELYAFVRCIFFTELVLPAALIVSISTGTFGLELPH